MYKTNNILLLLSALLFCFNTYAVDQEISEIDSPNSLIVDEENIVEDEGEIVYKIKVLNNVRIAESTILENIDYLIGEEYSVDLEYEVIESLYSTGFFTNIGVKFYNGTLEVTLEEAPIIHDIEISGNSNIKSKQLFSILESKKGESLLPNIIDQDIKNIIRAYNSKGIYLLSAKPIIEDIGNNRVKISIAISEGKVAKVKKIFFIGNENVSRSTLLSKINTSTRSFYGLITKSDLYNPLRVKSDIDAIIQYYKSLGYFNVSVKSVLAELSKTKEDFNLTYHIAESSQYKIGNIYR